MKRSSSWTVVGAVVVIVILYFTQQTAEAHVSPEIAAEIGRANLSLANPITGGKSRGMVVTKTAARIVATGQKCNLVVCNVNVQSRKFPVYAGYAQPDGGLDLAANGIPACDNSVSAFTSCPSTCFTFDAVPDSLYLITGAEADGGIPVRILEGTGCTSP